MSINSRLVTFSSKDLVLARTDAERDRINRSLEHLENSLKNHFGGQIREILRFGSYTRNTILPRKYDSKSDVDLMIIFNSKNVLYKPKTYRKWLADFLKTKYPNSLSKKDLPSVKLELNHIMFDLVPAYISDSIVFSQNYYIPRSDNDWMRTYPNDINTSLQTVNQRIGNNSLRNTIRLCKYFNSSSGHPFSSYEFEKEIIKYCNWNSYKENTFQLFYKVMKNKATNLSGVTQALSYIKNYEGGWGRLPNEEKQLLWLDKLLPGIKY